jgi:hypothetical protein
MPFLYEKKPVLIACIVWWLGLSLATPTRAASTEARAIPDSLKPWIGWATWDDEHRDCPTPSHDPKKHLCFWPSRLGLQVDRAGGRFELGVTVFHETWVPLPGGANTWPVEVTVNGTPVPVVEHDGRPAVRLAWGAHRLAGMYRWNEVPQRIPLPAEIGILLLMVEGRPVEAPAWDAEGSLWLKRDASSEEADKDFLSVKAYAALEDGIPLWLRTEIEVTVSGKSREEELGAVLPEGWKLASVESPIPVAVDDTGRMKAQVRAGKWSIRTDAFRFDNPKEFRYAAGAKIVSAEQLVAFRSRPDFRMVEIVGAPAVDVSQTTFPEKWRELPVYRWDTADPFRIEERLRGMGQQKAAGLKIAREWWLDEDGRGLTFRDLITGEMQQVWRLDAAEGQDLGSVRSGGQGQLITRNPQNNAPGVEIRTRALSLEATGRMARAEALPASGWRTDADHLGVTFNLPPGWRLFALFGADWVHGDWLTGWTLLDLFLLLIFTLAVFRLWGFGAALLAFFAFGLSYQEPGAPRYLWLILLVPLALLRVVPGGWAQRLIFIGKWIALACFIGVLVPFIAGQVQQALYPQLEEVTSYRTWSESGRSEFMENEGVTPAAPQPDSSEYERMPIPGSVSKTKRQAAKGDNLLQDSKARIQTGPGVPEWSWRTVSFGWNGPVQAGQQIRPLLIPVSLERGLSLLRVVLLLALATILLNARRMGGSVFRAGGKLALFCALLGSAQAQMPDKELLETLRTRVLEPSDAFPHAADIPSVTLKLDGRRLTMDAEIHVATRCAIPLPGRLPAWSPQTVLVDEKQEVALRREDGYLWLVLPAGVHRVRVEGLVAEATEWEWTFQLKPRRVTIEAPGWNVSGVRPDGVPEAQVFFARVQKATAGAASYDRQDVQTLAVVDRHLEFGLVWQVRTTVSRLSPTGKAVALRVPLLPGENVLSANAIVKDGTIEVRLGAQDPSFSWESGLAVGDRLTLATRAEDAWVERWHLVASPVWNVALSGLPPIFEPGNVDLVPVWQPWPGETVELAINRPEAIAGATVTVSKGTHEIALGKRQRVSKLELTLRCSLGEDFLIELPAEAEITELTHNGKSIPVRKDGNRIIVPLRPGEQAVSVGWKSNTVLDLRARAESVRLPVESANIKTIITVPGDRWVLWTDGPQRGPAVRFWVILICSLLAAVALGRIGHSPLRTVEWMLLVIGLTQVPLPAALAVVAWLFLLGWRGRESFQRLSTPAYNLLQVALVALTVGALGILIVAVGAGLLGDPEMFIKGNDSSRTVLRWFQARSDALLPTPGCLSISIWWYRFAMLLWALWLAAALLRWLRRGWQHFSAGGFFRRTEKKTSIPPPLPA